MSFGFWWFWGVRVLGFEGSGVFGGFRGFARVEGVGGVGDFGVLGSRGSGATTACHVYLPIPKGSEAPSGLGVWGSGLGFILGRGMVLGLLGRQTSNFHISVPPSARGAQWVAGCPGSSAERRGGVGNEGLGLRV